MNVSKILITPLRRIDVPGGDVLHAMKCSDNGYKGFKETYFSFIDYKFVKAWKRHKEMSLNLVVPIGNVKFVFVDDENGIKEIIIGEENYSRITVPPSIWFGFQGMSSPSNLVLNIADITHDPDEVERKLVDEIAFDWGRYL